MNKLPGGEKAASSKANCWVDPSFSDLTDSFAPSGWTKGCHSIFSRAETKTKRPRKRKGDPGASSLLKESVHRDHDEPWVDRYWPCSKAELAVHKKKIEEVENWMRLHTSKGNFSPGNWEEFTTAVGGILLLTGPSGCGKTATVQVLCWELSLRVQEWTNPTSLELYSSPLLSDWKMNGLSYMSQSAQFQEFLLRANKYSCLKMVGDRGVSDLKLILVEDFPNQFYRQPGSLHEILRCFMKTSKCPLVFIISDSLSGDSSSRLLFPRDILEELDISSISFNPVAPTTLMRVLTQISSLEAAQSCGRMSVPDQALLYMLCSGSSGDIRSAINSLQFSCLQNTSLEKRLWRMKDKPAAAAQTNQRKKRVKHAKEQEEEPVIGGKDASLFLFRALGKILHVKRGKTKDAAAAALPAHLSQHHREELLIKPELVVERSHMSGEFFNLYLHQNYMDFFSEVEDVDRASEYLSDADLLTANWTSRSTMTEYSSSVATRGLLHSNCQQVAVGFRPLHKPNWLLVNKKFQENCLAAHCLFRSFCLTPVRLQTELLPYFSKLTNPMRNQAQIAFIQDVGHMSLRKFPARLKLETLKDKEPGQLELDSDEEDEEKKKGEDGSQGGAEEGLPASQPQPTTAQVLLEEEDLLIEEYDSD